MTTTMKTLNLVLLWLSFVPCVLSRSDPGIEVTYKFTIARDGGGKLRRHRRATTTSTISSVKANRPADETQQDLLLIGRNANNHQATIGSHDVGSEAITDETKFLWDRILQDEGGSITQAQTMPPMETSPPLETSPPTVTTPPLETMPPTQTTPPSSCTTMVNKTIQ
jgi:hypothetical protein